MDRAGGRQTWLLARRVVGCLLLALAALPLGAGAAYAHDEVHAEPGVDLPRVLAVEPAVPGLVVTVIEGGLRLRIDNGTDVPVDVAPPVDAPRGAEPVIAPGRAAAWPDTRLDAASWTLPLQVGEVAVTVVGDRVRPAAPDPVPWWALTVGAALLTFALGATAADRAPAAGQHAAWPPSRCSSWQRTSCTYSALHRFWPRHRGSRRRSAPRDRASSAGSSGSAARHSWPPATRWAWRRARRRGRWRRCSPCSTPTVLAFGWAYDLSRASTAVTLGCGLGLFATGFAVLREPTGVPAQPRPVASA